MSFGQQKLHFDYDVAGNQTMRRLCINCPSNRQIATAKTVTKQDMIKSSVSDKINYYPNPVLEELYISWELVDDKMITEINLYSLSGATLQTIKMPEADSVLTVPFGNYPSGLYIVVLTYNDGKNKSIKVEKKAP